MEVAVLWDKLLVAMQHRIGHQGVDVWLKNAYPLNLDAASLQIEVENRYYCDWITENYGDELRSEAAALSGNSELRVVLVPRGQSTGESSEEEPQSATPAEPPAVGVNPDQTFDNFVIGECNRFAHAAAGAVADSPAEAYNPLYIYGASGLGKTHLLHAMGNQILASGGGRVVYVTAEDFMNEMINCIRYKRMEDFRAKYRRRASVLLVDDIQFLGGRDRTQEEFFHTFNALMNSGRQVILTSDVVPREIDKLEARLRTRFEGGLLADLQPPDRETLMAILQQKADFEGLHIPSDLAEAIASSVNGNVRELEGVLKRLSALHSFYGGPITLQFARDRMPNIFTAAPVNVTVPSIIEAVARYHSLRSADIVGKKRTRTLTVPRHIAMYLARKHTRLSFPELGREFGGRDHSTIQHGFRKVRDELNENADLAYKIRLIEQGMNIA